MFNEGFWFFYLVGLVEELREVGLVIILMVAILSICAWAVAVCEGEAKYQRTAKRTLITCAVIMFIIFFIPSPAAFYAGASQEFAEKLLEAYNTTTFRAD